MNKLVLKQNSTYSLQKLGDHGAAIGGRELPVENHMMQQEEEQILRHLHFQFGVWNMCCKPLSQLQELPAE